MLVLSRRPNEKIVFPTIQTEVQVLGMQGGQVRLGIDAPPQVSVIREELLNRTKPWNGEKAEFCRRNSDPDWLREFRHRIRNRLNDVGLALALLHDQMKKGDPVEADASLDKVEEDFRILKKELEVGLSEAGLEQMIEAEQEVGARSD
jgi:carbon storage regulator CsrA